MSATHPPLPLLDAVAAAVGESDRPASVAALFKQRARLGSRLTKADIEAAMRALAATGRLHAHPPAKPGGGLLVHHQTPVRYTTERLAAALARSDDRVSPRKLRTLAGKPYAVFVDAAIAQLAADGRIQPTRFLTARQVAQLATMAETINSLRPSPLTLAALIAFLDGAPVAPVRQPVDPAEAPLDTALDEARLVRWYADDVARLGGLRAVAVPITWAHYAAWCTSRQCRPDSDLFGRLLLDMAARSVVGLTPHEHEGAIAADVARVLPRTRAGYLAYYWTVLR